MKHRFILCFAMLLFAVQSFGQDRSYPFSWDNATVYFLLTDRFNNGDTSNDFPHGRSRNSPNGELDFQGGDLRGITQKIEEGYFDELGVNAIWITAPYEQMHGSIGSENAWAFAGYWTKDWSQIDDNMGSEDDLRTMVDAAHDHGIRVVMDIVMNHTGYATNKDAGWPKSWVRYDCEGGDQTIKCPLAGLPDIRTEMTSGHVDLPQWLLDKWQYEGVKQKEIDELNSFFSRTHFPRTPRYYIIKWLTDWVREYGIDGYRVDTAKHLEVEAWRELKEEAARALREWKSNNPSKKVDDAEFWMTGEVFGQSIYDGRNYYFDHGFDNIINFGFKGDLGSKSQEAIFSDYARRVNNDSRFNVLSYIASHDVAPYDRSNLFYAGTTLMLAPGGIQIYYGDESGREFFHPQTYGDAGYRKFMNWDEIANKKYTKDLLGHWRKLGRFRREHLSVGAGSHEKLSDSPYIFRRSYQQDKTMVVMNIAETPDPYTLDVRGTYSDGTKLKDYFSGSVATVSGGRATFNTSFGMLLVGEPFADPSPVTLNVSPASGHSEFAITVNMSASSSTGGSTSIYYTTNGAEPSQSSTRYTGAFTLGSDLKPVTLKARAYDSNGNSSSIVTRNYTFGKKVGFDLHYKNTNNWGEVYVYLFNKNGDPLPGWEWPGKAMTREGSTPWYKFTADEDAEIGIVFNNNNQGDQTDDLFRQVEGWYDGSWHDNCPGDCPEQPVPVLSVSPSGGNYTSSVSVNLSATNGGTIYYTTDGSTPSKGSSTYSSSLTFTSTTHLRAIAYNNAGASNEINEKYNFGIIEDDFVLHYKNTNNWNEVYVYLFDKGNDAALPGWEWPGKKMTKEGSTPWHKFIVTEDSEIGIVFNNNNQGQQTDDLFRQKTGWYDGTWHDQCSGDCPAIPAPVLSVNPTGGTYAGSVSVSLSATNGGTIYYTTNGAKPTQNSTVYSAALTFSSTTNLRAIAYNNAGASNEINERYTIGGEGNFVLHYKNTDSWNEVCVYLYDKANDTSLPGWSWPGKPMTKEGASPWYKYAVEEESEIGIVFSDCNDGAQTDDLFRQKTGWYDGTWHDSCTGDCPVQSDVPVLTVDPSGGTYAGSVSVKLSATNGGTIYYTTNGVPPTTKSKVYNSPITLTLSATLKAKAFNSAGSSNLVEEIYNIQIAQEPPVVQISPASGTYQHKATVTITATNGGEIYYTTNGVPPTKNSKRYTAPFDVTKTTTVKARAYNSYGESSIETVKYTIGNTPPPPPATGDNFTWDNAYVYFVMTDRFKNGDPSNDHAYGRGYDGNGNAYDVNSYPSRDAGTFHGGDIKGLTQKLEDGYFERIGVNAIWVTAPYEQIHGWVGGGPNGDFIHYAYHGYYTLDWSEMDDAMGTAAEFQQFVDLAHSKGIRIVMDIVLNHVGYTNFIDGEEYGYGCWQDSWKSWRPPSNDGWHKYHEELIDYSCSNWGNYWGTNWVRHPDINGYDACSPGGGIPNCVGFLPDIKTEVTSHTDLPPILVEKWRKEGTLSQKRAEIDAWFSKTGLVKTPANYIIFWITQWIKEYGVDGLRIDTAKHVEMQIWKRLKEQGIEALEEWKAANPDKALPNQEFWMTAEVWGHGPNKSNYHENGFNSVINFNLKGDNRLGREAGSLESLFSDYASNINNDPDFNVLSYVSSHDVAPLYPRDRMRDIAPALVLLPGGVQLFYGDEAARPEGTYPDEEQNTRSDFDWNNYDNATLDVFARLGRFRKNHPSIGAGSHTKLSDSPYLFMRDYENPDLKIMDRVAIAIGASGQTTLDVSAAFENGEVIIDAYTGSEYTVSNGKVSVNADSEGIILLEYKNPPAFEIRPVVSISPKGSYSEDPIEITIDASDEKGRSFTVYYTTDDALSTDNLSAWSVYSSPFMLEESATLRVIAEAEDGVRSSLKSERYAVGAIEPFLVHVWSPNGVPNIYTWGAEPVGITPDMTWPGVAMSQEGNGWYSYAIPALSSNVIFIVDGNQTEDLSRNREGWYKDGKWFDTCPGDCPGLQPPSVTISPAGKNFGDGSGTVSIAATKADAIFYTTDGSTPSRSSTQYSGSFTVSGSESQTVTVKAIAYNEAGASSVVSESYTFKNISGFTVHYWSPDCTPNIHVWNAIPEGSHEHTTWPGNQMTAEGNGWYSYFIPSNSANVIFNNCNGQTADLSRSSDGWFRDGSWSSSCSSNCPTAKKSFDKELGLELPEFSIYPNPTSGQLFFSTNTVSEKSRVMISNATGKIVFNEQITQEKEEFNINHLPKGVYLLKYISNNSSYTEKVILK